MNERLRDLMDELAGDPPEVADWSGRVRRVVAVRRRRQQALTAAAAVAVLAVGAATVALASAPARPDSLVGAAETSPSPVATASAPAPEAAPTVAPAPTVQPEPSAEPSPSPSVDGSPSPAPEPTFPPSGTQVIEITAQGRPDRPMVGQEWVLDVTATGSADRPYLQDACFDDGPCMKVATACVPRERDYSPPPPRPGKVQRTFRHTFTTPGRHEVRLEASATCSYYQGFDKLLVVVQVGEPPASSAPSPAPSAAPSTAPSPAASPAP